MKATEKAYQRLEDILNAYGFKSTESAFGGRQVKNIGKGTAYVSIQIKEMHDRYENISDFERFRGYGHLEVTASICRMGGEMTADDFAEAADQMERCNKLLKEAAAADLSYISMINGEEASE